MLKRYYRLELTQTAPLHLSNGDNESTDSDLMRDSRDLPFIPGSGLTGALRALLPDQEGKTLFGWIDGNAQQQSRVLVSDGTLPAKAQLSDVHLVHRDGVGLDLFRGTALKTAKYDFEAVETDLPYSAVLEWTGEEKDPSLALLDSLIAEIVADGLQLGGKTTRGYGAMKISAWKKDFRFPDQVSEWLTFSPAENKDGWSVVEGAGRKERYRNYQISFAVQGAVSVRVYSSNIGAADFAPLKNHRGQPVIPGTSWAGSFRHRMHEIARELNCSAEEKAKIDALFGKLDGDMRRSGIQFSQTDLEGGHPYELTRNALDRFTAGPAMSALYTAGYWQGGYGTLTIRVDKENDAWTPLTEQLLLAAIKDMHIGLLTLGGGASTGLGRVRITAFSMDGEEMPFEMEVNRK